MWRQGLQRVHGMRFRVDVQVLQRLLLAMLVSWRWRDAAFSAADRSRCYAG